MSRILEHFVECLLHFFPDGIASWFYHHAAADGAVVGQVCLNNNIVIPFTIILFTFGNDFAHKE